MSNTTHTEYVFITRSQSLKGSQTGAYCQDKTEISQDRTCLKVKNLPVSIYDLIKSGNFSFTNWAAKFWVSGLAECRRASPNTTSCTGVSFRTLLSWGNSWADAFRAWNKSIAQTAQSATASDCFTNCVSLHKMLNIAVHEYHFMLHTEQSVMCYSICSSSSPATSSQDMDIQTWNICVQKLNFLI
jgi:hypothetical protein